MPYQALHGQGRVLAALDFSHYTPSVARYAAWAATRMAEPLEFLHIRDVDSEPADGRDFGDEVQLNPLETRIRAANEAHRFEQGSAPRTPEQWLTHMQQRMRTEFDISADAQMAEGTLVRNLTSRQEDVDLFVMGKRGEYADLDSAHLGSQLERSVRALKRPVLIASRHFQAPKRALIAFDGGDTSRKSVTTLADSPLLRDVHITVLMVGEPSAPLQEALDWAVQHLRDGGQRADGVIRRGVPAASILRETEHANIDMLVMGAYGRSRLRHLIVGSTTTHVLRTSHVPVLLLR